MKINGLNDSIRLNTGSTKSAAKAAELDSAKQLAGGATPAAPQPSGIDSLRAPANGTFDTVKVDRIKQAIRDGEFQVNSEAVAHKLLSSVHELLGKAH